MTTSVTYVRLLPQPGHALYRPVAHRGPAAQAEDLPSMQAQSARGSEAFPPAATAAVAAAAGSVRRTRREPEPRWYLLAFCIAPAACARGRRACATVAATLVSGPGGPQ